MSTGSVASTGRSVGESGQPCFEGRKETLVRSLERAVGQGVALAVFTADLFATGNDRDNRAAVRSVSRADLARILDAAKEAADRAAERAAPDAAAGGCAHTGVSPAYRPPPRLWEYVTARRGFRTWPRAAARFRGGAV
jgi:hypothetical protein